MKSLPLMVIRHLCKPEEAVQKAKMKAINENVLEALTHQGKVIKMQEDEIGMWAKACSEVIDPRNRVVWLL